MAKSQYFNIRTRGTVGGVTYRMSNGQYIASDKSSLNAEAVKTRSEFVNTRKLNKEFQGCAEASRMFINAMRGMQKTNAKPYFYAKVMQVMQRVKNSSAGVFGQRGIEISTNQKYFYDYNVKKQDLESIVNLSALNYSRTSATQAKITIPVGATSQVLNTLPTDATHVKIGIMLFSVSDYIYNLDTGLYEAVNEDAVGNGIMTDSSYLQIGGNVAQAEELSLSFTDLTSTEGCAVFACIYAIPYKKVGDLYNALMQYSSLKIIL